MKRIGLTLMVILLVASPLFSYFPIVEPDPAYLPFILDSTSHYNWDSITNEWVGEHYRVYKYDANGNQTEYISYEWDTDIDDWVGESRVVNTYDADGKITGKFDYEWDSGINDWILLEKQFAYWSELATSIATSSAYHPCIIYPNPTKDLITIETDNSAKFAIYINSMNGQMMYAASVEGPSFQVDLSSFREGVYFITIRSEDFLRTEKIIKL